jgi:hypothetical protein
VTTVTLSLVLYNEKRSLAGGGAGRVAGGGVGGGAEKFCRRLTRITRRIKLIHLLKNNKFIDKSIIDLLT